MASLIRTPRCVAGYDRQPVFASSRPCSPSVPASHGAPPRNPRCPTITVRRRSDVVGIIPNEGAIIRLIGAVLLEANDEWQLQHRTMQTEAMAELTPPTVDAVPTQITTAAN